MAEKIQLIRYSHHFVVRHATPQLRSEIYKFASQYTQFGLEYDPVKRKRLWKPVKTFGVYVGKGEEFRFHIGQWSDFWLRFRNLFLHPDSYEIIDVPLFEPPDIELKVREGWELRDQQPEARDYVLQCFSEGHRAPLLNIATGSGKTVLALLTAAELKKRIILIVLAQYVQKWVGDITEKLEVAKQEIAVIAGGDSLQRCTHYPDSGLAMPKAFVMSLTTWTRWLKLYEHDPHAPALEAYGCKPDEFLEHLGIGTVIVDEAHQHPHAVYKTHCYMHVPLCLSLTATLLSQDPVLQRVHGFMYPYHKRFDKIKMKRYITAHACAYQILNFESSRVQITEFGQTSYSHVAFEKSILRHKTLRAQYVKMILDLVNEAYIQPYQSGDKLIVFVSTSAMAELLTQETLKAFPRYDTRTFLEKDPEENLHVPDIRYTTIIGGGTAHDIKQLRVAIRTISIKSPNSVAQALGRLRELPDRDVHFWYLYCSSIPKQVEYHHDNTDVLIDRTKAIEKHYLRALRP